MDLHNDAVAKNTIIEGGGIFPQATRAILVDQGSTLDNLTFEGPGGKGAGVLLGDPLGLKGVVKGLAVNDYLSFGGLAASDNVNVTGFTLSNDRHDLTITYGNDQHVASAPAALAHHEHTPFEFDSPLVGFDAHNIHFGPGPH
jgi:hypothetical protein